LWWRCDTKYALFLRSISQQCCQKIVKTLFTRTQMLPKVAKYFHSIIEDLRVFRCRKFVLSKPATHCWIAPLKCLMDKFWLAGCRFLNLKPSKGLQIAILAMEKFSERFLLRYLTEKRYVWTHGLCFRFFFQKITGWPKNLEYSVWKFHSTPWLIGGNVFR
jgi:hypothetical protein